MRLAIGGLIRDRLPQLQVYLRHLRLIDWPDARWVFTLDNCQPETERLVTEAFPEAALLRIRDGAPGYARDGRRAYAHLASLRNQFSQRALTLGVDGVLSVDSDIVAVPELAARLLETTRPWVSALVDNSRGKRIAYNVLWRRGRTFYRKPINWSLGGAADLIGAVCFYRRDLLERVSFDGGALSEDACFSASALAAGFSGWYVPLELEHLMTEEQLAAHMRRCTICATPGGMTGGRLPEFDARTVGG